MQTSMPPASIVASAAPKINLLTVSAIGTVAYLVAVLSHEALGHGLTALLFGAHIRHVSSVDLDYDMSGLSAWANRCVAAAGCVANIVIGIFVLMFHRRAKGAEARYFLWLLGHVSLFIGGGYLMTLSFAPFGDWYVFTKGLHPRSLWCFALTVTGTIVSVATLRSAAGSLSDFLGEGPDRRRRSLQLTLTPYLVGSLVNTLAGVSNPVGPLLILISAAAASFGGTVLLVRTGFIALKAPLSADGCLTPAHSRGWIAAGAAALFLYFVVFGPGLPR